MIVGLGHLNIDSIQVIIPASELPLLKHNLQYISHVSQMHGVCFMTQLRQPAAFSFQVGGELFWCFFFFHNRCQRKHLNWPLPYIINFACLMEWASWKYFYSKSPFGLLYGHPLKWFKISSPGCAKWLLNATSRNRATSWRTATTKTSGKKTWGLPGVEVSFVSSIVCQLRRFQWQQKFFSIKHALQLQATQVVEKQKWKKWHESLPYENLLTTNDGIMES